MKRNIENIKGMLVTVNNRNGWKTYVGCAGKTQSTISSLKNSFYVKSTHCKMIAYQWKESRCRDIGGNFHHTLLGNGGEHCKSIHGKEVISGNFIPAGFWWMPVVSTHACHLKQEA